MPKTNTDSTIIQKGIQDRAIITSGAGDLLAWIRTNCDRASPCSHQRTCAAHKVLSQTWKPAPAMAELDIDSSAIEPRGKTNKIPRLTDKRVRHLTSQIVNGDDRTARKLIELVAGIAFESPATCQDLAGSVVEEAHHGTRASYEAMQSFALQACLS